MKYKLKKSYPGSPELGYITKPKDNSPDLNNYYYGGSWFAPSLFPEFWEKVEDKTYEILSFKSIHNAHYVLELTEKGYISKEGINHVPLETLLINQNFNIHSVKRLSDGEIFTVGEEVDDWGTKRVITGFSNESGWLTIPVEFNSYGKTDLTGIKKVKQPLFTTEDGVEKFEGDLFVPVNVSVDDADNYTIRGLNSEAKPYNTKIQEEARKNGVLWFSTKEAAEEYILMNKPCLSVKEVVDILANYALTIQSRGKIYHTLVEKATQRNDSK